MNVIDWGMPAKTQLGIGHRPFTNGSSHFAQKPAIIFPPLD